MSRRFIDQHWQRRSLLSYFLYPISLLYRSIIYWRRRAFELGWLSRCRPDLPVVIVGNIVVGGAGKTPLTIALVNLLKSEGWSPGVVSRGYRSESMLEPAMAGADSDPAILGDEPVMIASLTGAPVVVFPARCRAVAHLRAHADVDIVVCDDGLQHYALERDLELVVVNAVQGHGNGWCLPAGPLREPPARLSRCDMVVTAGELTDGYSYRSVATSMKRLSDGEEQPLSEFKGRGVHGLAGIAHPERFFEALESLGLQLQRHAFIDHHRFTESDLTFDDQQPIVMTEKDAIKCQRLPVDLSRCWQVSMTTELSERLSAEFLSKVQSWKRTDIAGSQ